MEDEPGAGRAAPPDLWTLFAVPAAGAALAASGLVLADGLRHDGGSDPEALLGMVAAALGTAVVLGWALAAALAVLAVVAGHRRWERLAPALRRCSPAVLRRAAAAALGLQLVGLSAVSADEPASPFWGGDDRTPVHASAGPHPPTAPPDAPATGPRSAPPDATADGPRTAPPDPTATVPAEGASAPDGPARTGDAPGAQEAPGTRVRPAPALAERTVEGEVTVLHGDTLWSLAAAHLGPGATDAEIARCWPVWYELNRHVLRDGPHLLLPGQRLVVPGPGAAGSSTLSPPDPGGPS